MISVIRNTQFWSSASNMLILLLTDLLKALIPPFIFAECILAVNSKRFSFWTKVLLLIPGILPGVAGTIVWVEGYFRQWLFRAFKRSFIRFERRFRREVAQNHADEAYSSAICPTRITRISVTALSKRRANTTIS